MIATFSSGPIRLPPTRAHGGQPGGVGVTWDGAALPNPLDASPQRQCPPYTSVRALPRRKQSGRRRRPDSVRATKALRCRESGRLDLNQRPLGPQPSALPDCATPRDGRHSSGACPTRLRLDVAIKRSAGILLHRPAGDGVEVLLVHPGGPFWAKKDLGAWSIPKGEVDEGEETRACALRELAEELGSPPPLEPEELVELGEVRQKAKIVEAWAAEADFDPGVLESLTFSMEWPPRSGRQQEFPEVDRAEWFDPETARRKILPAQAELIDRLLKQLAAAP